MLASRSPQRDAILRQLKIPFRVHVSGFGELGEGTDARALAEANARGKAHAALAHTRLGAGELVLGVDTVVVLEGRVFGKARDADEALHFVTALAGATHTVISGLCLTDGERAEVGSASTDVTFRSLDDAAAASYIATGEWHDRAGAYAIQGIGSALVSRVEGDYWNVVGLPVALLLERLAALGSPPFSWL